MDVTKPYKYIGLGAMDVTKPYTFIGFGPWRTSGRGPGPLGEVSGGVPEAPGEAPEARGSPLKAPRESPGAPVPSCDISWG